MSTKQSNYNKLLGILLWGGPDGQILTGSTEKTLSY